MTETINTGVTPKPLPAPLQAYYDAMALEGPMARNWADKPHRLVYDLIAHILFLESERG